MDSSRTSRLVRAERSTSGALRHIVPVGLLLAALLLSGCQDSLVSESASVRPDEPEVNLDEKLSDGMDRSDLTITDEREVEAAQDVAPPRRESSSFDWDSDFGTGLNQGDDACDKIPIGFPFHFYGNTYKKLWVNSNGNITLTECNVQWSHPDVPDEDHALVAPLYGDFSPAEGGDVFVHTKGSAPDRVFVATWSKVPEFSGTPGPNSFQVKLFEGSHRIQFGYNGLSTDGVNWSFTEPSDDPNMDVGISSGEGAFIHSASGPAIPALDETNICYVPDGNGGYVERVGPCGNVNRPPVADAGADQTVECQGEETSVSLDGSGSSDPDDDPLVYSWSLNGTEIATGPTPTVDLPDGSHTITLTVTDPSGASDSDDVTVDVVDTTAPELSYRVVSRSLWPPNHTMRLAVAEISASDICDSNPELTVEVSSNEPVNGTGDGNTTPDWEVVEDGDGTFNVLLRAERRGPGNGRTYTVTITAEDAAGNVTQETVTVDVPHDQSAAVG